MIKLRSLGVAAVFLAGCAVGGASSRFFVPAASAQQTATLTRWEYTCFEEYGAHAVAEKARLEGAEGWELAGVSSGTTSLGNNVTWCFKRPKM